MKSINDATDEIYESYFEEDPEVLTASIDKLIVILNEIKKDND